MKMSSKEKAKELVDKFLPFQTGTIDDMVLDNFKESDLKGKSKLVSMMDFSKHYKAKQCALICVDEIIDNQYDYTSKAFDNYWQEVKQEIEKL